MIGSVVTDTFSSPRACSAAKLPLSLKDLGILPEEDFLFEDIPAVLPEFLVFIF